MSTKKLYGLVGYPLSHSFSKSYFSKKFEKENIKDAEYLNFEIKDIQQVIKLISENPQLIGFNVTIPYKEGIIPFLDEIDDSAAEIGAVNTVCVKQSDSKPLLKGYNTDYYGFKKSLTDYLKGNEKRALVFGNGGAAKAVVHALKSLKINYLVVSRSRADSKQVINYENITTKLLSETDLLINTTPLGMWPNVAQTLEIPYQAIKKGAIVYDLIYNPAETLFLKKAKEYAAIVTNGLKMLELQAEQAWMLFNSEE